MSYFWVEFLLGRKRNEISTVYSSGIKHTKWTYASKASAICFYVLDEATVFLKANRLQLLSALIIKRNKSVYLMEKTPNNISLNPMEQCFFLSDWSSNLKTMCSAGKYTAKILFHQSSTWHSDYTVTGQWWFSHRWQLLAAQWLHRHCPFTM